MTARADGAILVCAMGKDVYLDIAERWIEVLRAAGRRVLDLRASVVGRAGLLDALDTGPALVLYAGHGRARGWAGYQTVRWEHLAGRPPGRPAGLVVALACDTLAASEAGTMPFGERLVREGRAAAYIGAVAPMRICDGTALGDRLVAEVATGGSPDAATLLDALSDAIQREEDAAAARALATLRLVGDPVTPLPIRPDRRVGATACGASR